MPGSLRTGRFALVLMAAAALPVCANADTSSAANRVIVQQALQAQMQAQLQTRQTQLQAQQDLVRLQLQTQLQLQRLQIQQLLIEQELQALQRTRAARAAHPRATPRP